jgi:hypothetical protein
VGTPALLLLPVLLRPPDESGMWHDQSATYEKVPDERWQSTIITPLLDKDELYRYAFHAYPSIQEIVLISQFAQHREVYRRYRGENEQDETIWKREIYGPSKEFEMISVDICLAVNQLSKALTSKKCRWRERERNDQKRSSQGML